MVAGTAEMKTPTGRGASGGIVAATWKLGVGDDAQQTYGGTMLAQRREQHGRRRKPLECSRMRHGQLWHGDEEARRHHAGNGEGCGAELALEWSPTRAQAEIEWRCSSSNAPGEHQR